MPTLEWTWHYTAFIFHPNCQTKHSKPSLEKETSWQLHSISLVFCKQCPTFDQKLPSMVGDMTHEWKATGEKNPDDRNSPMGNVDIRVISHELQRIIINIFMEIDDKMTDFIMLLNLCKRIKWIPWNQKNALKWTVDHLRGNFEKDDTLFVLWLHPK